MLVHFRRRPDTAAQLEVEPRLEWPDLARLQQTFWVEVTRWDYKVFPSMGSEDWGSWLFQFEGRTKLGSLKGLSVGGEVSILEPNEDLGGLADYWKNVPKQINGIGFLSHDKTDSPREAHFYLELYCKAKAFDWVYRSFLCGFLTPQSGLGIEVSIAYPDPIAPDFWKEQWRRERWQITSWKLFSGMHLTGNPDT